ncbi:peptidoglycan-binding protein, partial [Streptomyces sp. SID7499]|nr:peptidoglycan-binding protein [Streptomyces sp. SID7499]
AVDGGFGSVTTRAVRAYQSVNRLVVDGEAGPVTWRALTG